MGRSFALAAEATGLDWRHVWRPVPASAFSVRGGAYLSDKKKAPSAGPLFEIVGGDCVISDGPIRHFASRVALPDTSSLVPNGSSVPALLVMNVQVPVQPRAMFGARKLPPTVNAVFYMRLTPETAAAVARLEAAQNGSGGGLPESQAGAADGGASAGGAAAAAGPRALAEDGPLRLLLRWCRDAQTDDVLRGTLKLIGDAHNFADVGAPSFVQSYNAKPVLLAGGGLTGNRLGFAQIYRGHNYLEVDVDVAEHFTYLSQRGICWALGLMDKLSTDIAFVVEGRSEDELPEAVLCCVHIDKMPVLSAVGEAALFGAASGSDNRDGSASGGGADGLDGSEANPDGLGDAAATAGSSSSGNGSSGGGHGAAGGTGEEKNEETGHL
jgi:hypothetical protein